MAKNTQAQIEALVASFTADLTRVMQDAVSEALRGTGTAKAGKKTTAARRAGGRASSDTALDERLFREIKKQGGRRLEELAVSLNVDSKRLKLPARRLVAAKRVKKSGQARGTKYRAA